MGSQNSINNIVPENSFTVQKTAVSAGTNVVVECQHTDTTNTNSNAILEAKTLSGGGDAAISSNLNANQWTWGQSFGQSRLFESVGLPSTGVNTRIVTTTGYQTMPKQSAFMAYKSANTTNASGDGTLVTVVFDTVYYDQGSNYNNSTGVFTAPVTGRYFVYHVIAGLNIAVTHNTGTSLFSVNGTNTFVSFSLNPGACRELSSDSLNWFGQEMLPLNAGDTVTCGWTVGGSTKTVTLAGNALPLITTRFGAYLMC